MQPGMQPGDQVQWTQASQRGRTISMSLKRGVLIAVSGQTATVQLPSGKKRLILLSKLQPKGARSAVAAVTEAIIANNREDRP